MSERIIEAALYVAGVALATVVPLIVVGILVIGQMVSVSIN